MSEQTLTGSLQENVLTLLCFSTEHCPMVAGMVSPPLFDDAIYRRIAEKALAYYEKYKAAPGNHLPDLLEAELHSKNVREAKAYKTALQDLRYASKEGYRPDFILSTLRKFVRSQRMKIGVTEAAQYVQQGDLDKAEDIFLDTIKKTDEAFAPGLSLLDIDSIYSKLMEPDLVFPTGVVGLDNLGIGPCRQELFLYLAPTNKGKTWGLINLGKHALLARKKVLHITLEMSDVKISERYLQSLFSMPRRPDRDSDDGKGTVIVPRIKFDEGEYKGIRMKTLHRPAVMHELGRKFVRNKLIDQKLGSRYKLIVKQFPTGALTIRDLNMYLDMLERYLQFVPDILILDYADLMDISSRDLRVETGMVYKKLRGIGVERDMAVASASQSNRMAEDVKWVTLKHMGEDYSKAATADTVVSYNQTALEKKLGLARLFVAKGRNEKSGDNIILTQAYGLGQFSVDSTRLVSPYWEHVEALAKGDD